MLFFALVVINLIAFAESYRFINGKSENKYLEEPQLNYVPINYPILTILYVIAQRHSFNISLTKVSSGKYFLRPKLSLVLFLQTVFLNFFGINRLFIAWTKFLLGISGEPDFASFLLKYASSPLNKRVIVFSNGVWRTNPKWWDRFLPRAKKMAPDLTEEQIKKIYRLTEAKIDSKKILDVQEEACLLKFADKEKSMYKAHTTIKGITKDTDTLAYITDLHKAEKANFYGRDRIINQFEHVKTSTLLEANVSEFNMTRKAGTREIYMGNALGSAWQFGYNKDKISEKHGAILEEYGESRKIETDILNGLDFDSVEERIRAEHLANQLAHQLIYGDQ